MRPTSRMPSARAAILEMRAQARHDVARQLGRAAHRDPVRLGRLEAVVVDVEAAARRRIDDVLDRQQHALVAEPLDEGHGHVDAGDELLDEHAGRVGCAARAAAARASARASRTTASSPMPFDEPS